MEHNIIFGSDYPNYEIHLLDDYDAAAGAAHTH
jgi:hypothetical protein